MATGVDVPSDPYFAFDCLTLPSMKSLMGLTQGSGGGVEFFYNELNLKLLHRLHVKH